MSAGALNALPARVRDLDNVFDDKGYISVAGGRVSGTGITTAPGINVKFSTTVDF